MRFLVDENLPMRMAAALVARGHEANHCTDILGRSADDGAIWRHAVAAGAAIITKDDDYLAFLGGTPPFTAVVWLRIGNCSRAAAIERVVGNLDTIAAAVEAGQLLIEL